MENCLPCILEMNEVVRCTASCLIKSNISPNYAFNLLISTFSISIISFLLSFLFSKSLKKLIILRCLSISFFATFLFSLGLIFGNHFILKNLAFTIPLIGLISYFSSYFFSFYIFKYSYPCIKLENRRIKNYVRKISKRLKVKIPEIYVIMCKEKKAFAIDGFKKAIFISNTILKYFKEREIKIIILHEILHLKRKSGLIKNLVNSIFNLGFRVFPVPIKELEKYEEEEVDRIIKRKFGIDIRKIKLKL